MGYIFNYKVKYIRNFLVYIGNRGWRGCRGIASSRPHNVSGKRNMACQEPCPTKRDLEMWYKNYYRRAVNVAYRFTRDRDVAEDIAQEAFLRIYTAQDPYQPLAEFKTYLFQIIRNLCIDRFRKEQRLVQNVGMASLLPDLSHEKTIDRIEVEQRLARLPRHVRKIFILFYLENRPYKEIAQVLNIPEKTVGNILYYWGKKIS